jgi:hypothetical protein
MDPRKCHWQYVVTQCKRPEGPRVMLVADPVRLSWQEVRTVEHRKLSARALIAALPGGAHE